MVKYSCGEYMKKFFLILLLVTSLLMFVPRISAKKDNTKVSYSDVKLDISDEKLKCSQVLGHNGTELVKLIIIVARVGALVLCVLQMMLTLGSAVMKDDPAALRKAGKKCVMLAVIMAAAFLVLAVITNIKEKKISC